MVWQNSVQWYQEAAKDGSPLAKYELGMSALSGKECSVDKSKSLFWLTSAANENVLDAQLALGYEYISGLMFTQDVEQGLALIKRASDQGLSHAQVMYGWLIATLPSLKNRPIELAEQALAKVDEKSYTDMRSYYETQVALALIKKNWSDANQPLKRLSKLNLKYDVSRERELALQAAYDQKVIYTEQL